jgi:predicted dehydrogenase
MNDPGKLAAPLRVAIVGLGQRGLAHTAVVATLERATLVGLADPDRAARRSAAGAGFHVPLFARFDRMLAATHPDAVLVSAPLAFRAGLAGQALAAGAAVLTERPIAPGYETVSRIVDQARSAGRLLMCSNPLLHQPVFARALELVRTRAFGAVRELRASVYVSRVFSAGAARRITAGSGGGVTAHAAFDLLGLVIRMLGMPLGVRAEARRLYGDDEDELRASLALENGTTVGLDCSWSVPGYPRPGTVLEIAGDAGHLLVSDDGLELDVAGGGHQRWSDADLPQPARFDLDGEPRWIEDSAFVERVLSGAGMDSESEVLATHALMRDLLASAHDGGREVQVNGGAAR